MPEATDLSADQALTEILYTGDLEKVVDLIHNPSIEALSSSLFRHTGLKAIDPDHITTLRDIIKDLLSSSSEGAGLAGVRAELSEQSLEDQDDFGFGPGSYIT